MGKTGVFSAVLALLVAAYGAAAGAQEKIKAGVGVYTGALVAVPAYIAKEEGIYDRHGLDVTLVDFRAAPEATAALFSKQVDLISNSPGNMMLVNSRGRELVNIIDNYPAHVWSIVVRQDMATPNKEKGYPAVIHDLKGKTIGVPAIGSDGHNFARRFLRDAGMNPETDATFLAVGLGPEALAAFKAGQLDAVMAIEPVQSVLVGQGGKVLLDLLSDRTVEEFATWTSSTYESTREHANANAEMMRRFQTAQEEAIAYLKDPARHKRVAEIWSKYNRALPVDELQKIVTRLASSFDVRFNCPGTANVGKFQVNNGLIKPEHVQSCEKLAWEGAAKYLAR